VSTCALNPRPKGRGPSRYFGRIGPAGSPSPRGTPPVSDRFCHEVGDRRHDLDRMSPRSEIPTAMQGRLMRPNGPVGSAGQSEPHATSGRDAAFGLRKTDPAGTGGSNARDGRPGPGVASGLARALPDPITIATKRMIASPSSFRRRGSRHRPQ
jgi:hypothetical protein